MTINAGSMDTDGLVDDSLYEIPTDVPSGPTTTLIIERQCEYLGDCPECRERLASDTMIIDWQTPRHGRSQDLQHVCADCLSWWRREARERQWRVRNKQLEIDGLAEIEDVIQALESSDVADIVSHAADIADAINTLRGRSRTDAAWQQLDIARALAFEWSMHRLVVPAVVSIVIGRLRMAREADAGQAD